MTTKSKATPGSPRVGDAARMARALSHPLRASILVELSKRTASPVDLSRDLGVPVENVAYHVKTLVQLGCIELVGTRPRRGAVEHFYRSMTRPELTDEAWARMTPEQRRGVVLEWFRRTFTDVSQAMDSGAMLEAHDLHLSYTSLELDDAGWAMLAERLGEVVEEAFELQARAAEQGAETSTRRLAMALYDPAPVAARARPANDAS